MELLPLAQVSDTSVFGSKAVGLGRALRDGLPVPPGFALSGPLVEAVPQPLLQAIEGRGQAGPVEVEALGRVPLHGEPSRITAIHRSERFARCFAERETRGQ